MVLTLHMCPALARIFHSHVYWCAKHCTTCRFVFSIKRQVTKYCQSLISLDDIWDKQRTYSKYLIDFNRKKRTTLKTEKEEAEAETEEKKHRVVHMD